MFQLLVRTATLCEAAVLLNMYEPFGGTCCLLQGELPLCCPEDRGSKFSERWVPDFGMMSAMTPYRYAVDTVWSLLGTRHNAQSIYIHRCT